MNTKKVWTYVVIYLSGVLFAVGLGVSGMTNPHKVIGFLDFFGKWDATLLTVLGAATGTNLILFRFVLRRSQPVLTSKFLLPTCTDIDKRLILGAALFGVGWGLAGYCPGPGLTSLASGSMASVTFVMMMGLGHWLSHRTDAWAQLLRERRTHATTGHPVEPAKIVTNSQ